MKKLQQFYVMKFPTDRLKKFDYKIKRTLKQARDNQELISLGDGQALRSIREIRYRNNPNIRQYNIEDLCLLNKEKKVLKKSLCNKDNIDRIIEINNIIDEMLYVPEYIAIKVDDDLDYEYINNNGFYINDNKYVRLSCSAGQARVDTAIFVQESIEKELKNILKCGAKDILITENKYNAYFALASSSTHIISTPNVLLVPDYEIKMVKKVDWISKVEKKKSLSNFEKIESIDKELDFNLFDGCGLISVEYASKIAEELELDYIPSGFCIRNAFIKGMVFVADINAFRNEFAPEKKYIIDYYKNNIELDSVNLIITKSMFKLADAYDSIKDYQYLCDINHIYWGVTRVTPKYDNDYFRSNYQFCQVLNLNENDINELCQPTINWLKGVSGENINFILLYLLGEICNKSDVNINNILNLTSDNIAQAIILNNNMLQDEYIKKTIIYSINKKIKESYIGKLILEGNFSVMIPDIVALLEYVLGLPVKGALKEFEHYSHYWNNKNIKEVVAMRSPLTWRSEVNKLNLVNNNLTDKYFKYLNSGIVYNVWGCDCIIHADSDNDGDLVATTNNPVFLRCRYTDLPITYKKSSVNKKIIKEEDLYKADLDSFHSTIGHTTNGSTSMYEMLAKYKNRENCEQYKELINRLKLTRKAQGDAIDKAKGIKIQKSPYFWTKKIKINKNDNSEIISKKEFLNEIVSNKHPYFFRYLYYKDNKKYNEYIKKKEQYSLTVFNKSLKDIINVDNTILTEEEINFKNDFINYQPLINYHGVMNNICNYMEDQLKELNVSNTYKTPIDVIKLMQYNVNIDENKILLMQKLYDDYNVVKKIFKQKEKTQDQIILENDERFNNIEQYCSYVRKKAFNITNNNIELANLAIEICYFKNANKSKEFAWKVFGNYIIENIYYNKQENIYIPVKSNEGDIKYLTNKYELREINI